MKIAIVAPSSVPFTVGGAENLYWGLQNFINEETQFQCELIKVPSHESTFPQIVESYKAFSKIELNYFDTLISTKYPSWMISHPNHVCYMLHTLRGLYDTYHFMREPEHFEWAGDKLISLKNLMQRAIERPDSGNGLLLEFFAKLDDILNGDFPAETFRFPGPFSRQIVHFLDSYGLAKHSIKKYSAISTNVKGRLSYFPSGANVSVLYPPPRLRDFRCEGDDYLFTTSRLDGPKRIGLLIEAMRHVKSNIPLLIGGTGPDLERLKILANGDPRVKFLGFLSDDQLLDYYANALAILFVPYDEDYGYITIEAMKSGKPVLTVSDSGGPNEFVINGETGFSVQPEPEKIAERIDYLCTHRSEARAMGRNAQKKVSSINWHSVVEGLIGVPIAKKIRHKSKVDVSKNKRKKIVVAVTFPIYPPRGGGQSRVFHLYKNLAQFLDVEIVSFCNTSEPYFSKEISPGLKETRIPKSAGHQDIENKYSEGVGWIPVTDVIMSQVYMHSPAYVDALRSACVDADVAVACHPYLADAIREVAPDINLWLEAQDVEFELKRQLLPDGQAAKRLLDIIYADEHKCWKKSGVVFACAKEDLETLNSLYGATTAVQLVVPNGVSLDDVQYFDDIDRLDLKNRLKAGDKKLALFMGSWHGPNLEAIEQILVFSNAFPDVTFLIVGSAGLAFAKRVIPENVVMVGVVDDEEKNILLGCADVALNPMTSGTGSNLKMLDYFSAGVPVISTPFGARGIEAIKGIHYISAEIDAFILELTAFFSNPLAYKTIVKEARKVAETSYSWAVIAENFYAQISKFLEDGNTYTSEAKIPLVASIETKLEIEKSPVAVSVTTSIPTSSIIEVANDTNEVRGEADSLEDDHSSSSKLQQSINNSSSTSDFFGSKALPEKNFVEQADNLYSDKLIECSEVPIDNGQTVTRMNIDVAINDSTIYANSSVTPVAGGASILEMLGYDTSILKPAPVLDMVSVTSRPSKQVRSSTTERNRAKAQRKKKR